MVALLALAACSSTPQRQAEWSDPGLGAQSHLLRNARVLAVCEAYDPAVRRICQDQLARELTAKGATPLQLPGDTTLLMDRELDGQLLPLAAKQNATAVVLMTLTPENQSQPAATSLGLGGFSFGGGGGAGVGLSLPIGGGRSSAVGFAANGRVLDTGRQRLVWTATFVAPAQSDLGAQFDGLSKSMLDAAQGAGLF